MARDAAHVWLPEVLDLFRLVRVLRPPGAEAPVHAWHEFVYVLRGQYEARTGAGLSRMRPGDVIYYPAGTPHAGDTRLCGEDVLLVLHWRPRGGGEQVAREDTGSQGPVTDAGGRLLAVLTWIEDLTPPATPEAAHQRDTLLHLFLQEYRALGAGRGTPADVLARAINHIRAGMEDRGFSLAALAAQAGVSPSTLCRAFQRRLGVSPMRYQRDLRVRLAIQEIAGTDRPLTVIAERLGFYDGHHLSRLVKQTCGRAPMDLRRGGRQAVL